MSFGRNPHVAKAEAAEEKAKVARDASAYEQAWREAARQWDRAAERETDDKRKRQYTERAEGARTNADSPVMALGDTGAPSVEDAPVDRSKLN